MLNVTFLKKLLTCVGETRQRFLYEIIILAGIMLMIPSNGYGLTLEILSTPSGAQVSLNGKYQGKTPLKIPFLSEPTYVVKIVKEGYQNIEERIKLNSSKSLHYRLQSKSSPQQAIPQPTIPHPTPTPHRQESIVNIQEKRVALIIGNSQYQDSPLRNPSNDAQDVASSLLGLGFQVTTKLDLNQKDMEDAIYEFADQIRNGDIALFYYSGHGSQLRGENYLIPVHERIRSASDIRYKAVNMGYILAKMEESNNRTNIIILDACRNNPFKGFKSQNQGFAPVTAPRGTFIAYATSPGSVAWESPHERNSIYTKYLLQAFQHRGMMIEQTFKEVLRGVEDSTNGQQTPWIASSLRGDFYFNP